MPFRWSSSKPRGSARRTGNRKLFVEQLEDRTLLSSFVGGALDASFGEAGIVTKPTFDNGSWDQAIAVQPDGKILSAASFVVGIGMDSHLMRFNTDGSPDTTFGDRGVSPYGSDKWDDIQCLVLQPDGKILAAGQRRGFDFALARYNADGSADASFGDHGFVFPPLMYTAQAHSIALQPDGKIVVAGQPNGNQSGMVARYLANGTLDRSFGAGGFSGPYGDNTPPIASAVALQPDGKIVLANDWLVIRLNADGQRDQSFGQQGAAMFPDRVFAADLALQPDGKIIVGNAGTTTSSSTNIITGEQTSTTWNQIQLGRFNTDGSVDTTFGTNGVVATLMPNPPYASQLAVQLDGKIVVVGGTTFKDDSGQNVGQPFVVRYNPGGNLDRAFGNDGFTTWSVGVHHTVGNHIVLQNDGKMALEGWGDNSAGSDKAFLARLYGGFSFAATEHTDSGFQKLAAFLGTGDATSLDQYSADVDWGDGKTSTGTIGFDSQQSTFTVTGNHTYDKGGDYVVRTIVHHAGGPDLVLKSSAVVADLPLHAQGKYIQVLPVAEGLDPLKTTHEVATFNDDDPAASINEYRALIDWGDGTTPTPGTISGSGTFHVTGQHAYSGAATSFNITVTVKNAGYGAAVAHSTASYLPNGVVPAARRNSVSAHRLPSPRQTPSSIGRHQARLSTAHTVDHFFGRLRTMIGQQ